MISSIALLLIMVIGVYLIIRLYKPQD